MVAQEVASFIQEYEENVNGYPGWENHLIYEHSNAWSNIFEDTKVSASCMKDISPFELANILIKGYEVEPQFKVGDLVVGLPTGNLYRLKKEFDQYREDQRFEVEFLYGNGNVNTSITTNNVRHATQEEIKAEEKRQLWKSIGREIGEFKIGDVRILEDGNSVHITDVDYARAKYIQGTLKGFFPVESLVKF